MTLPTENSACKCEIKNCSNCKCSCGSSCCCSKTEIDTAAIPSVPEILECSFVKAHPNWQQCPFMSKMFETSHGISGIKGNTQGTCDSSKSEQIPSAQCASCHSFELNHIVTLQMDTAMATDQSEENNL